MSFPGMVTAEEMEAFQQRMAIDTAPPWMPETGDILTGTVIGFRIGRDTGYGEYPIIVYKKDDGSYTAVHAFHTLLRDMLKELKPTPGVTQIITYLGVQEKRNATDDEKARGLDKYHMYYGQNAGTDSAPLLTAMPDL